MMRVKDIPAMLEILEAIAAEELLQYRRNL